MLSKFRSHVRHNLVGYLALFFGAIGAIAVPAANADPQHDSVTGGGTTAFGEQFSINAMSGPLGENPTGQVRLGTFSGDVACLGVHSEVQAGAATIGVPLGGGGAKIIYVLDGGPGEPDALSTANSGDDPAEVCDLFGDPTSLQPIDHGQITVHDATPSP
jgi:hypothetical protein